MEDKIRINKYLAMCNVDSRRKCEEIILAGRVKVNGEKITNLATMINPNKDKVVIKNKEIKLEDTKEYYMLNKPKGIISAAYSKYGEETVVDLIEEKENRLFPVGRLDKDTTGLIFLTNDGDFAYKLTHPKFEKAKTYEALLEGKITSGAIGKLEKGIIIDGKRTAKAKVRLIKVINSKNSLVEITLIEGRNRQVKKMCKEVDFPVIRLKRISEGDVYLGSLKEGEYRKLSKAEITKLMR